jgi:putative NIF3 family GTP cyclohydrolase 1 type 2
MTPRDLLSYATRLAGFSEVPADSCVVFDTGRPLRRMLASINVTTGDLLLAKQMGCDGVLLHHPLAGSARREFHKVFDRFVELISAHGVPAWRAREAVADLRMRVRWSDHAADWDHLASAAELIDISLVNVHLPADELGRRAMVDALAGLDADATLGDAAEALRASLPELAHPSNEICFLPDDPARRAGPIAVLHAGGTNGGAPVAECLFKHTGPDADSENRASESVGTVLYIHISGDAARTLEARAQEGKPGSLIITGHLASDAIGMNILMDALRREHHMEVIPHGGLRPFAQAK